MGIVPDFLVVLLGCLAWYMGSHIEMPFRWQKMMSVFLYSGALAFFLIAFLDFFHMI